MPVVGEAEQLKPSVELQHAHNFSSTVTGEKRDGHYQRTIQQIGNKDIGVSLIVCLKQSGAQQCSQVKMKIEDRCEGQEQEIRNDVHDDGWE